MGIDIETIAVIAIVWVAVALFVLRWFSVATGGSMDEFPRFAPMLRSGKWVVWDRMRAGVWTVCPSKEECESEAKQLNERHQRGEIPTPVGS